VSLGQDPAVLTWMIALAPRPRVEPVGHHWWRDLVTAAYREAREAWEIRFDLEANTTYRPGLIARERRAERRGGRREVTDFLEQNPPPVLRDFMTGLSRGALAPERLPSGGGV
jgi:hypothetical protein